MVVLDSNTKSLELVLGSSVATNQLDIVVSYKDSKHGFIEFDIISSNTTPVTIIPAPSSGNRQTKRRILHLSINNSDTQIANVVISINNNSSLKKIISVSLNPNDTLFYEKEKGFYVLDSNGGTKSTSTTVNTVQVLSCVLSGTDNYTGTLVGVTSVPIGVPIWVKCSGTNTGASTFDLGGGAKVGLKFGSKPLIAGDLVNDVWYAIIYDGTNFQIPTITGNDAEAV